LSREIVVDVDGALFRGGCVVSKGFVTVYTAFHQKSAPVSSLDATEQAKGMLAEIVREEVKVELPPRHG